jgi:hypothetical protein
MQQDAVKSTYTSIRVVQSNFTRKDYLLKTVMFIS